MLVGYPPFFSDDPSITCQKILQWKKTLNIPKEAKLSGPAEDILKRLLCDADNRLGANGIEEIKNHPFFDPISWDKLQHSKAPYIPDVKAEDECSRFDNFEEEDPFHPSEADQKRNRKARKDINFVGYTYKKDVED